MSPSLGDLAQDLATSPNAVMIGPSNQADGEVILFFFFRSPIAISSLCTSLYAGLYA